MKNFTTLRHPIWIVAGILGAFGLAVALGGTLGLLAEGGLALAAARGLMVLAFIFGGCRLARYLELTTSPEVSNAIAEIIARRAEDDGDRTRLLVAAALVARGLFAVALFLGLGLGAIAAFG